MEHDPAEVNAALSTYATGASRISRLSSSEGGGQYHDDGLPEDPECQEGISRVAWVCESVVATARF